MNASLKVILLSACLLTFVTFVGGTRQQDDTTFRSIVFSGQVLKLRPYFGERLQLKIGGVGHIYSARQAAVILEDFLTKNRIKSFKKKVKGGSGSKMYIVGRLYTDNGNFNVSIYYTHYDGHQEIVQQIRIEKHEK